MNTIANARIAQAAVDTLQTMIDKGLTVPSHQVQVKSMSLNATGAVEQETLPTLFYHVKGEHKDHYMVVLKLHAQGGHVVDWECSCPAGQHDQTCAHAVAAIIRARLDGHPLRM